MDWVLHALEYGALALCMLMYFHETRFTARQTLTAYLYTLLFSGTIGLLNEIWQARVPNRSPSWSDEVANLLGAALFIGLFHIFKGRGKK
ncbi:MAG: VanZ family protein [Candidatus Hatepunaea meridiana]|nr:VanZ family protein [Candidatus Hatepunaea meridiana]